MDMSLLYYSSRNNVESGKTELKKKTKPEKN